MTSALAFTRFASPARGIRKKCHPLMFYIIVLIQMLGRTRRVTMC